ncbi:MAG: hypothetical protein QME85_11610 [Candidatus Saccharicenans sp.]|nr:hypothetical protein [Candidatus Saccharicenans sp.]MDI6849900.1 hypothetical protein [Candidatus Saccharicenans sp.]
MPGIVGIITSKPTNSEEQVTRLMLETMLHESFYSHGIFVEKHHGFFIGYLAIQNSFSDCMPVFNETKDIAFFLTGECFDDPEIQLELKNKGHKFNLGNASYLVHRYEELGENLFRELNGWFNGIILDLRLKRAFIFNDRFGIRRLYIYETPDFVAFATEAKALLRGFPELREIDGQGIGEFLMYDCVLKNRTYFPRITLLPPASAWRYEKGKLEKESYLNLAEFENQPKLELKQFSEELAYTFQKILPRYFQGEKIGLGLTGG